MKRGSGLTGRGWKPYTVLPPMFLWPELSFMAKFTAREAGNCGMHVVPGERGNSSQLWHVCSLKHTSVESLPGRTTRNLSVPFMSHDLPSLKSNHSSDNPDDHSSVFPCSFPCRYSFLSLSFKKKKLSYFVF